MSTAEAACSFVAHCTCEIMWAKSLLGEFEVNNMTMKCANKTTCMQFKVP